MFRQQIIIGLKYAAQARVSAPLYLAALLLGLIQTWPLFGNETIYNPILRPLAADSTNLFVDLATNSSGAGPTIGAWSIVALLFTGMFAMLYNLFAGGMLSAWAGNRTLWAGSRYFFGSFVLLGSILIMLLAITLAIGIGVGFAFGTTIGAITAISLVQLVNLLGEYARAAAIAYQRRNPFVLLSYAARTLSKQFPRAILLAVLGIGLHVGIVAIHWGFARVLSGFALTLLEQGVVIGWLWIKTIRLAWALSITQACLPQPESVL